MEAAACVMRTATPGSTSGDSGASEQLRVKGVILGYVGNGDDGKERGKYHLGSRV